MDRLKPRGLTRLIRALESSRKGFLGAYREEAAFRQELWLAVVVIPLGLYLGHDGIQRVLLVAPMILVLIVELINSAIEATVDRIGLERHALSGLAKEMGSAAVLLALGLFLQFRVLMSALLLVMALLIFLLQICANRLLVHQWNNVLCLLMKRKIQCR